MDGEPDIEKRQHFVNKILITAQTELGVDPLLKDITFVAGRGPVKVLKTKEEKEKARREYREEYMTREDVIAKNAERLKNEEVIEKRNAYAKLPTTIKRKKELALLSRKLRNQLKKDNPKLYDKYVAEILHSEEEGGVSAPVDPIAVV